MKIDTITRIAANARWAAFRGDITPERNARFQVNAELYEFRKNPHHRCDTCSKALSQISGPRCAPCLNATLRM